MRKQSRIGSSARARGKGGKPPPPPPPPDPLAHLTPELRAFAESKADAEARLRAGETLPLEQLILTLPGYDPRVQAGDCTFDAAAAQLRIDFVEQRLVHIEGEWAGRSFELRAWQRALIANIFGWKRPDGFRRFREVFIEIPRKNGKTPLAAAIVLCLLVVDNEPGAQIYSAAGDRSQAALIYRHASEMVTRSLPLRQRLKPHATGKSIEYRAVGSFFRALSKEARTKHGFNTHGAIIDELHVQNDSRLVDVLTSSTGTRRQPLILYTTTADYARESICNEKERHAEKVAANLISDPEFLPVLFRAPKGAAWDDEATWYAANPQLGVSIKIEEFRREAREARRNPRVLNEFKRVRLNIKTNAAIAWVPMDLWDACGAPPIQGGDLDAWIDELGLEGEECWGALDLGKTADMAAFLLWFPKQRALLPYYWSPQETAHDREKIEGVSYEAWAAEGLLRLCPGKVNRFEQIRATIRDEVAERFRIREIAFDRWGAAQICEQLEDDGFDMLKFGQGYGSMSTPSKAIEAAWLEGSLRHGSHPILRWNASNVMVVQDEHENIKPTKKKSTGRIDGFVAAIMAFGAWLGSEDGAYTPGKGFKKV